MKEDYKGGFMFKVIKDKVCCFKNGNKIEVNKDQYFSDDYEYCHCRKKRVDNYSYQYQTVKKENIVRMNNHIKRL